MAAKEWPRRREMRLKRYDCSHNGRYFITICVEDRQNLLGTIPVGAASGRPPRIILSHGGKLTDTAIQNIATISFSAKRIIKPIGGA